MQAEQIFMLGNAIALIGWAILIFLPFWHSSDKFIVGLIITLFAIVYTWLMFTEFAPADTSSFSSLQGVMTLFKNPRLLLAGWIHYLAFDLLAGVFIKKNGARYNISHWLIIPCLFFTFMLGPFGLLLYLLIRLIKTKRYFSENF
jgi:hypothetical protein